MVTLLRRIRPVVRFLHTAWSIAGITLIAILLTEAGFRLVFAIKDHFSRVELPDRRVIEEGYGGRPEFVQHYRELGRLEERWEPYVYFRQKPFSGRTISIDRQGHRLTWQPPPAPAGPGESGVYKVLTLGGSSLWGYGARDDRTIPSLIARSLHERGYRMEVRNLAEIGYVSSQELVALVRELQAGYRPDLVVFYDGVNDTTSALIEGEAGVTTNEQNRRAEFNIRQSPGRLGMAMVARLVEDSASYRFARVIGRRLGGTRSATGGLPPAERRTDLAAEVVRTYRANIAIIDQLARGFGFDVLYYWQPVVFDKRSMTPFEREEASKFEWSRGFFREVYDGIRGSSELAGERCFHDLSRLFADAEELVYIDYCHTTESANERIARAIAGDVEAALQRRSSRAARPLH